MPYEWNNKIVVTKDELIPGFFPSWDALKLKLFRDAKKSTGIRRARQGKGLNNELLIDYDTLPPAIRNQIPDPRKVDCIMEKFFSIDAEAVRWFSEKRVGRYGYIDPARQMEYVLDASVLRSAIRLREARIHEVTARPGGKLKGTDKYLSVEVNLFNEVRRAKNLTCHTLPIHHLRLKDKIKRFEEEGYESLLKGYKNQNALQRTESINRLLNAIFIQKEKPSKLEVFRRYDAFLRGEVEVINPTTGELYNPSEYTPLSEKSVTAFLARWSESVATHKARSADRQQYMAKYEPYQKLEHPKFAGSIISIDDRQLPFIYDKNNHRVWFYIGIDLGSECIVGFVWGKEKNAAFLLDFYREVVRNCAEWGLPVPAQLECESHLNSMLKETLLLPGNLFEYVDIYPNSAHSKRIERYFRSMRYSEDEKGVPGWIGRPWARDESNQTAQDNRIIVPYDRIVEVGLKEIERWNNSPCSIYPDKTRFEIFCEKQHPDVKPINWHGILPHLGEWTATSCNHGQIRLNGDTFLLGDQGDIATGDALIDLMSVVEGKAIDICWLRGHKGQVLKAHIYLDGRCVCEAIAQPVAYRSRLEARSDPQAAKNMELVERYKNTIRGYAQRHKKEIEKLVLIDHRKKTLNDNFKIDWYATPVYDDAPDTEEEGEPAGVEEAFNDGLNDVETYRIPSLVERFAGHQ
ncbi:MAG: hypothetical protein LBS05_09495 [Tannerellaceae bacterium]|jgi:hypothetical protein|nr:hypothetical protein [Tannerellaceae bacterium]